MRYLCTSEWGETWTKDVKFVFIGYPKGVKDYRLWVIDAHRVKIIVSIDVSFNENEMYAKTINANEENSSENTKDNFQFD